MSKFLVNRTEPYGTIDSNHLGRITWETLESVHYKHYSMVFIVATLGIKLKASLSIV